MMCLLLEKGAFWDGQAATLSVMLSVMLRSTQSLGPEMRASAKRSLVIAFKARLVNSRCDPSVPECQRKGDLIHCSKTMISMYSISLHVLFPRFLLTPELFPLLLFFPLAFLCFHLPLPVALLSHHVPLLIWNKALLTALNNSVTRVWERSSRKQMCMKILQI